jgi:signal transduction histidine kinase
VRFRLRWKILLFTVLPPVVLTAAALWFVNRNFSQRVHENIREVLERSAMLFEHMLEARSEKLAIASRVVVRDPRFFAVLTLPGSAADPHYRETVKRVATDFNAVARVDVFEVLDGRGRRLASVGASGTSSAARDSLVRLALGGQQVSGILIEQDTHYQAAVTPVFADRRIVGALVLGSEIGDRLAREMRALTRSEVTFLSSTMATGSSLEAGAQRTAVRDALLERGWLTSPGAASRVTRDDEERGRPAVFDLPMARETWITLVQSMPGSDPSARQTYLMQRSLDQETAFLGPVRRGLVQLGLVAALAALIAGIVISEQITRPVHRLVKGAIEMEQGNYDYPLGVTSQDEIGFLARRFETMRMHERDYVNSLEDVARLKGDFLNVATHELRTPISIIQGYHELLEQGVLGPITPGQRDALSAIGQGVESLGRIAENASWMAQLEGDRPRLEVTDYDVGSMLESAVRIAIGDGTDRKVRVFISADPDLGIARFDAARMCQAIASLIRNGIVFTPDGGSVEVAAWRETDDLVIEVRDSGIGMNEDEQRHIFNRPVVIRDALHHHSSSNLEFKSSGLGLGLSISRTIVEAHGGTIGVTSAVGSGSTFAIRLPGSYQRDQAAAA